MVDLVGIVMAIKFSWAALVWHREEFYDFLLEFSGLFTEVLLIFMAVTTFILRASHK